MENQNLTVFVASSVGIDYYHYLKKTIALSGIHVRGISLISESNYRRQARSSGISKILLRLQMYVFYPLILLIKGVTCTSSSVFVVDKKLAVVENKESSGYRWDKIRYKGAPPAKREGHTSVAVEDYI